MIVDKINQYLNDKDRTVDEEISREIEKMAGATFKRQFMVEKERSKELRLSSGGKCARALAYSYHGFEPKGKEIDPRAKIVFWTGDLAELTIVSLAKVAGANVVATGLNQTKCKIVVEGKEVWGHPDGILIDLETREYYLLEVKSMPSYSFERFEQGVIDEGYLAQINLYMDALNLKKCVVVALNKEAGVLAEKIFFYDPYIVAKAKENLKSVVLSTPENLPDRPAEYGPDAKGLYTWNCLYCSHHYTCRPTAEKVLVGKSYKLKELKNEPASPLPITT